MKSNRSNRSNKKSGVLFMNSAFTLTFGQQPQNYIDRTLDSNRIYDDFNLDFPLSHVYIITGVRGSGKTVLLTDVSNRFKDNSDWVVVDVNPNREILSQIAAQIYDNTNVKHLFLKASFSFSFHGFGFTIEGKEPVSNVKTILEKMLDVLNKNHKKVLITIDEISNNLHTRSFVHDFQSLLRDNYEIFLLMTGLYENVFSLQNNKNLTFLYRAPKIDLKPLDINMVYDKYAQIFTSENSETIRQLAELTKGYAFAYQVVGFLFSKYKVFNKIFDELDKYLSLYTYDKIWANLPSQEKKFLKCFKSDTATTEEINKFFNGNIKATSVYRDRLIKRGLIDGDGRGNNTLTLPRFEQFINRQEI